ncbi:MAG TPA: cellulase family glycosylhydrolase, partial [Microthrixaceae bacterium]|nr:cellulase family glycosylhydrolase [Microthrixaceae bacterium]
MRRRCLGVLRLVVTLALGASIPGCSVPVRSGQPTAAPVGPVAALAVGDNNGVSPAGRFTIVGRDIVDPTGHKFYPIGANVAVRQGPFETGYIFNWNGTATDHAADVKAWGWNIVRANLICVPPGAPNATQMNDGIDAFINEYTALGIVVMVDCHDVTGRDYGPADPQITALYPFWEGLAQRWKDN